MQDVSGAVIFIETAFSTVYCFNVNLRLLIGLLAIPSNTKYSGF